VRLQSAQLVENVVPTSQDVHKSAIAISVVEQKFRRKWDAEEEIKSISDKRFTLPYEESTENKLRLTRGDLLCLTRRVQKKILRLARGEEKENYSALRGGYKRKYSALRGEKKKKITLSYEEGTKEILRLARGEEKGKSFCLTRRGKRKKY
jgi:hypothetical protein